MKKIFLILALSLGCCYVQAQNNNRENERTKQDNMNMQKKTDQASMNTDHQFVKEAARAGMHEVEMGEMGKRKAMSQRVKDFADMMVRDHTRANDELKSIVSKKNNMTMPQETKMEMKHMEGLTEAEFDKPYMEMMVNDHRKAVDLFQRQSKNGKDADLKSFATKTLPTLQMHLDSAVAIQSYVNSLKPNMGEMMQKEK